MASLDAAKWKEAMKSEIQSMYDNQVWNLVATTPGLKMVGCKWIFKKKTNMDGKVHTYKSRVTGYWDASWQTNKDDSRSQSGWVFLLNRGAVTWKNSKQDKVADFTCESEYITACKALKEAIWMNNFIGDLGLF
nr:putative retrotransposon protein [Tanacetum cinerariifolium]